MAGRIDPTKICLLFLLIAVLIAPSAGKNDLLDDQNSNHMALSIYVDKDGDTLITGYAEDVTGLDFLSSSQYQYKNQTSELYALTNLLTSKYGNNWTLSFPSHGYYDEYHAKFLLPGKIRLRKINCSAGLEYIIYTSNDSFIADVMGYDLQSPVITLEYQMPTEEASSDTAPASSDLSFLTIVVLFVLSISVVAVLSRKIINSRPTEAAPKESDLHIGALGSETDQVEEAAMSANLSLNANGYDKSSQQPGIASTDVETLRPSESNFKPGPMGKIAITPELEAVMEVLTVRERTVLEALLKHGGRMTQAEIRYETETPGSTLTGILVSLERRKIVTKKEQGRTNVIELSEWFLPKKKGS